MPKKVLFTIMQNDFILSTLDRSIQIDSMPAEKYSKIKEYLASLNEEQNEVIILDKETNRSMEKFLAIITHLYFTNVLRKTRSIIRTAK